MIKKSATQNPTGRTSYQERVSKKESIRQQLQALKDQTAAMSSDAFNKKAVAEEAARALQSFKTNTRNENERMGRNKDFMDEWQKDKLQKLKSDRTAPVMPGNRSMPICCQTSPSICLMNRSSAVSRSTRVRPGMS